MTKEKILKRKKGLKDNIVLTFFIGLSCFIVKMVIEVFLIFQNTEHIGKLVESGTEISKQTIELLQLDMYTTMLAIFCAIVFLISRHSLKKYSCKNKVASK